MMFDFSAGVDTAMKTEEDVKSIYILKTFRNDKRLRSEKRIDD